RPEAAAAAPASQDSGVPSLDAGVPALDAGPVAAPGLLTDPQDAGAAPTALPSLDPPAAPSPAAPPAPTTTVVQVPMPFVQSTESSDPWEGLRAIIPGIPTGG